MPILISSAVSLYFLEWTDIFKPVLVGFSCRDRSLSLPYIDPAHELIPLLMLLSLAFAGPAISVSPNLSPGGASPASLCCSWPCVRPCACASLTRLPCAVRSWSERPLSSAASLGGAGAKLPRPTSMLLDATSTPSSAGPCASSVCMRTGEHARPCEGVRVEVLLRQQGQPSRVLSTGVHTFGLCATALITNVLQLMTGNPTPFFLTVCKPNYSSLNTSCEQNPYVMEDICTGGDQAAISQGRSGLRSSAAFVRIQEPAETCIVSE